MELLTHQQALDAFYAVNKINPALITDHYDPTKHLDQRLFQLGEKSLEWLETYCTGEQNALIQLLACYRYFTDVQMLQIWQTIFDRLERNLNAFKISWSEVLFVTTESSKGVKSGAANIQADFLKVCLDVIRKDQVITMLDKQPLTKLDGIQAVIFLDDIVATGLTLQQTIQSFLSHFQLLDLSELPIQFYWGSAVFTKRGQRFLSTFQRKYPQMHLQQVVGVQLESLFHLAPQMQEMEKVLQEIEARIDSYDGDGYAIETDGSRKTYAMGFAACKLLVSTYYDTPNNTLCSFWRVTNQNKPPFRRLDQPCTLYRCQQKKRLAGNHAYAAAALKGDINES